MDLIKKRYTRIICFLMLIMVKLYVGNVMQESTENRIVVEEIKSVEELDFEGYVYDACCEDPHLYLTNDFISHNCILWIDEIDKGLSGTRSSGSTDGGTGSRVFSTFLTWMQEKTAPVFVAATANDHTAIPAEFLRAGRFDEIFFVNNPNRDERKEIFDVQLIARKYNPADFDALGLAKISNGYSGAEIEKAIDMAMLVGFSENKRLITDDDIEFAIQSFRPLSEQRADEFEGMAVWAESNCVSASEPEQIGKEIVDINHMREIDLE